MFLSTPAFGCMMQYVVPHIALMFLVTTDIHQCLADSRESDFRGNVSLHRFFPGQTMAVHCSPYT